MERDPFEAAKERAEDDMCNGPILYKGEIFDPFNPADVERLLTLYHQEKSYETDRTNE